MPQKHPWTPHEDLGPAMSRMLTHVAEDSVQGHWLLEVSTEGDGAGNQTNVMGALSFRGELNGTLTLAIFVEDGRYAIE